MGKYSDDPAWADVVPLPTDEGGPNPLAAIAYTPEYEESMSYLRALMATPEYSPRALSLTEHLISLNPAHYTVWLYRAACLRALSPPDDDLGAELAWLNATALAHEKNYQIWHHRQGIVDARGDPSGEADFLQRMLDRDAKNYHVWSYRQWLVRRFALWDDGELEFAERMLQRDVRNNSAWNHRWFVVQGRANDAGADAGEAGAAGAAGAAPGVADPAIRARELRFAQDAIARAPRNASAWNYLRGVARASGMAVAPLRGFVERYASLGPLPPTSQEKQQQQQQQQEVVRSSHALDLLVDILAEEEEQGSRERAGEALDLLANRYDPIRKNYWEYRKARLGLAAPAA